MYYPKTPKSGGRKIPLNEYWYNHHTDQREYFGLPSRIESFFGLSADEAPENAEFGHSMFQAHGRNGLSRQTLNNWVREVCAEAGINAAMRRSRLADKLTPSKDEKAKDRIRDFGRADDGTIIPDIFVHDMRASYCTQLVRTEVDRNDEDREWNEMMEMTGHANIESLQRYVTFAKNEMKVSVSRGLY
jgi:site-specific recombinase XerD